MNALLFLIARTMLPLTRQAQDQGIGLPVSGADADAAVVAVEAGTMRVEPNGGGGGEDYQGEG